MSSTSKTESRTDEPWIDVTFVEVLEDDVSHYSTRLRMVPRVGELVQYCSFVDLDEGSYNPMHFWEVVEVIHDVDSRITARLRSIDGRLPRGRLNAAIPKKRKPN